MPLANQTYQVADFSRILEEKENERYRSAFRRDAARVLHSPSFRRMQGKMQLFPQHESDFFRNRLTHSLEVGQIAKSIAIRLNDTESFLYNSCGCIDVDLVEMAGWTHDIGHPPFGHTGEEALDECMRNDGGFEGNAQTLRLIAKIEKKRQSLDVNGNATETGFDDTGNDHRQGLNLCMRSLASILKYDSKIPPHRDVWAARQDGRAKGYYLEETELINHVKESVSPGYPEDEAFRTIECSIMDIADDIAYSTYDIEDAFKAEFLKPLDFIAPEPEIIDAVQSKLEFNLEQEQIAQTLHDIFAEWIFESESEAENGVNDEILSTSLAYHSNRLLADNGYARTYFTSSLVGEFIRSVCFIPNHQYPPLSTVKLNQQSLTKVEILKHFVYQSLIKSPDLEVQSHRGKEIVRELFNILTGPRNRDGRLMPRDFRKQFQAVNKNQQKRRIVCDFISTMTDAYAIEYFKRLSSEAPPTVFKRI